MSARPGRKSVSHSAGFTLVELMVGLVILAMVTVALMAVIFGASRSRTATVNQMESMQSVRAGLDLMTRDLRSAGYGADLDYTSQPQPGIAYVDSMEVLINANLQPYPDNVSDHTPPLAYDPAGTPRPRRLDGTPYTPPIKYRTGAEVIRWTLDVSNDGAVNADDLAASAGADALHTPNPGDYVLVRQVYGDSTGNVAGANGGAIERVALVDKPGGGVPPIFVVYMKGSSTPWDWNSGPVPPNQLANIVSVQIQLTASSGHKSPDGKYAQTTVRTQVATSRNVPDAGGTLYAIGGYVYNDKNRNHSLDTGEPGIPNAVLMLGPSLSARTDATGHYQFQVVAGTYRLKQTAPVGYGVFTSPDSTILSVGPPRTISWADTARTGGWANVSVFYDQDGDGYRDPAESGRSGIKVSASPSSDTKYTDGQGKASLFLQVGSYAVTMTPPDSLFASTSNPVSGSVLNGDTVSVSFGLRSMAYGQVAGKVYRDMNKNGVYDAGEAGVANLWVGATKDGGATVSGYATTDANGDYTIQAPVNDPPHATPYSIYITPPSGYFPTSAAAITPVWITDGGTTGGKNFGVFAFQLITLQGARVLSLANGDLVERDWPTNQTQYRAKDLDLLLGSDANGSDQISAWFNRYNSATLFQSSPDYTRSVGGSVFAIAADTLDPNTSSLSRERADVVAGSSYSSVTKGNWYVWINQGSSGNEGYLETAPNKIYYTKDKNDVTVVLTADLYGNNVADGVDVLLGTATRGAGIGGFELWSNNNGKNTSFAYQDIYPPEGQIPNDKVGEVTGMALADFDGDAKKDLVVTTRTLDGTYSGQIMLFKNQGRTADPIFLYKGQIALTTDVPNSVAVADLNGDGYSDVIVGTQNGPAAGRVQYWKNTTPSLFEFTQSAVVAAPGLVSSVVAADMGGAARRDILVGYRTTSFGGGLRIYYTDLGGLPGAGVDPTGGAVTNFVPTITTGDFNYGVYPSSPYPPFLDDIAAGVKINDTTGALVLMIR